MPTKIIVVDDEKSVLDVVRRYLESNAFTVVSTNNSSDALLLIRESEPDLILTDAEMPGLDGYALCRIVKNDAATRLIPVIIMSGNKIEDNDILAGFAEGADDYVMKPLSFPVLFARIKAVLSRYETSVKMDKKLKKFGLELDPLGRTVKIKGKPVSLTRKEFDLLSTLINKAGRFLSVIYLLETVWGYDPAQYNDPRTVEVHIFRLRKKLGKNLAKHIVSSIGHGYKFEE